MRTFKDFQIKNRIHVKKGQIHGFACQALQIQQERPGNRAQTLHPMAARRHFHEPDSQNVGLRPVADQIAFPLQMSKETVGGALVKSCFLADFLKPQALGRIADQRENRI